MTFKDIFPGLSRTFQVLEFARRNPVSRTFQEAWEP